MQKTKLCVALLFGMLFVSGCNNYQPDYSNDRAVPVTNNPLIIQNASRDQIGMLPY